MLFTFENGVHFALNGCGVASFITPLMNNLNKTMAPFFNKQGMLPKDLPFSL